MRKGKREDWENGEEETKWERDVQQRRRCGRAEQSSQLTTNLALHYDKLSSQLRAAPGMAGWAG